MNPCYFPHPELCIDGLPSRAYTESACLAALLLLVDRQRRIEQQLGVQLAKPINTYCTESLLDVMENILFHHSHNSKVVQILVECEIKTIIMMTCPGFAFANIYYCGIREDVKVEKYINFYRDWLTILPSCEQASNTFVLQAWQTGGDPTIIAKALTRLDLLSDSLTEEEMMYLFEFAVAMTPHVSEAKYGKGYEEYRNMTKVSEFEEIGRSFLLRHRGGAELIQDLLVFSSSLGFTKL